MEGLDLILDSNGIVLLVIILLVIASLIFRSTKLKSRANILKAIIESFEQPLLFFDENNKLKFYSSGLILFDKDQINQIHKIHEKPIGNKPIKGEFNIDSNLYRYQARSFEYLPGRTGTIYLLEYVGASTKAK